MKAFATSRVGGVVMVVLAICLGALGAAAQDRMSDKDVETTMNNLRQDSKKFSSGGRIQRSSVPALILLSRRAPSARRTKKNRQKRWCSFSKIEPMEC
jgi:hypothetical protein